MNEPNAQLWPQREPDVATGQLVIADRVAKAFQTARRKLIERNSHLRSVGQIGASESTVLLAGPAVLDIGGGVCQKETHALNQNRALSTPYDTFVKALFRRLHGLSFNPSRYFIFTAHNYRDIECDRSTNSKLTNDGEVASPNYPKTNSASWLRRFLVVGLKVSGERYRWRGWPNRNRPELWLTEGGARLNGLVNKYDINPNNVSKLKSKQAALVVRNFNLLNLTPVGEGVTMVSQYLSYTDTCWDDGTHNYLYDRMAWDDEHNRRCPNSSNVFTGGGGGRRPLFLSWSALPSAP